MGRITRNYLYNAAYQLLVILTPVITAPYLARILGADRLGIYSYINSSGNIITTCTLLGIYAYGNRQTAYVRDQKGKLTETFWEIEFTRLLLGICGTAVYLLYSLFNTSFTFFFILYYPYIFAQFIDCTWVFVGLEDMKPAVMKNMAARLLNVAGIFLLVRKKEDIWIYILLLAGTALLTNIAAYSQVGKYIGRPSGNIKNCISHIRGSLYLFLPQVAALFYLQVDKVMLQWITGLSSQVSFYDQAEKLINIPLSLISVLSTVMMPRIANEFRNGNQKQIESLLQKAGRYALFMAFPMMLGLFCIAGQFVPWYLGNEFLPVAGAMMILSPIVLLNTLSGISGQQYFTATNQIPILLKAYVSAAVLNVIMNALLIPRYGYAGAAAATVGSAFLSTVLQYRDLTRQIRLKGFGRCFAVYGCASVIMAVVIHAATYKMPAGPGTTIVQILIGIVVYMGLVCACRDITVREVLQKLAEWKNTKFKTREGINHMTKKPRSSGIEMLKIIAVFLIIISHVTHTLGDTGNLFIGYTGDYSIDLSLASSDIQHIILIIFKHFGAFGNLVFFMCSAWFLVDKDRFSAQKIIRLESDIWIVSVLILTVFMITRGGIAGSLVLKSLLPTTFKNNWYMTCYMLIFAIHKPLNMIIHGMDKNRLLRVVLVLSGLYLWLGMVNYSFYYESDLMVLITVYFIIAYHKKYMPRAAESTAFNLRLLAFGTAAFLALILATDLLGLKIGFLHDKVLHWDRNCNPFLVMTALGLFNLARKNDFVKPLINRIAGMSFLVYIIHENILVRTYLRPWIWLQIHDTFGYRYIVFWCLLYAGVLMAVSLLLSALYTVLLQKYVHRIAEGVFQQAQKLFDRLKQAIMTID